MIEKHCFFIDAKSYKLIQSIYKLKGFKSPSALVNQAISDWFARDAGKDVTGYLRKELHDELDAIKMYQYRLSQALFRLAVSDAEIKKVLAMEFDFDEDTLADIYDRSIREVRSTNGFVNLIETVKRIDEERESFRWRDEYR
ncbi:MAG: hypothetical protein J5649_01700 [Lachnospiraceae bacterium]|nr:hypothetical protein [Lachnospiraceae bacterium]